MTVNTMFQPTSPTLDNKEHDIYPLNNCGRQEQKDALSDRNSIYLLGIKVIIRLLKHASFHS